MSAQEISVADQAFPFPNAPGCDQQPEAGQVLGAHNRPTGSAPHDLSVTEIDKKVVGDGATGDLTRRLIQLYDEEVKKGEPVNVE